ncbi:LysR family transcriptional regulator [Sphingomonas sp. Leaf23]|uniref:LysR family transcriptional regulator n=1 Tax=Sphingomonas sp. Leaf23 TaxID=1735689 RepID=UPI0006FBA3EE|nr:LysR family transcriptional regulator [Sphingomonas sp. Leaf23]KQM85053.1 LysR family transcriptional regulator [Sphingomonas sp. Leaf23]
MARAPVPLNALRAFEASARHLSFTRAADELCVTQAAVSHQIKALESRLGVTLFRRSNRGLLLTDEGMALAPTLVESFGAIDRLFDRFDSGIVREVLTVSAVGTFAVGALLERLPAFRAACPGIDLRLLTNNNQVDLVAEGLDGAIRFGDGAWHGVAADAVCPAPLTPLCSPAVAQSLRHPADLLRTTLLRSYRAQDWPAWFAAAGLEVGALHGPLFDSSLVMVQAAMLGEGVALAPPAMFRRELDSGRIVQPFATQTATDGYWLTRLKSRPPGRAMVEFRRWLLDSFSEERAEQPQ